MSLTEAEYDECRVELANLRALPGELGDMPEAQARMAELKALEPEGSVSGGGSLGVALAGLAFAGLVVGVFLWSRE